MKEKTNWSLSVGFYPGILFGIRSYNEKEQTTHVFYLPFVDVALESVSYTHLTLPTNREV